MTAWGGSERNKPRSRESRERLRATHAGVRKGYTPGQGKYGWREGAGPRPVGEVEWAELEDWGKRRCQGDSHAGGAEEAETMRGRYHLKELD